MKIIVLIKKLIVTFATKTSFRIAVNLCNDRLICSVIKIFGQFLPCAS